MGEVYRARNTKLKLHIAIKSFHRVSEPTLIASPAYRAKRKSSPR
jgi:hypothetical protein